MQSEGLNNLKREAFRYQIRRRQIDQKLAEKRKQFLQLQFKQQQESEHYAANQLYIRKSMSKNLLVDELPTLLPSLSSKIKNKPSAQNIQFVLLLSSNILRDDISLQQKQYIYKYCNRTLNLIDRQILSPLIQVYFYESVMATCYDCLDEKEKIDIELKIIPRLVQLMFKQDLNMKTVSNKYTLQECKIQMQQGIVSSFYYFYQPDLDNNNSLLYKVQRTAKTIVSLIQWAVMSLSVLMESQKQNIIKQMLTIFINISQVPIGLTSLLSQNQLKYLMMLNKQIIQIDKQQLQSIKSLSIKLMTLLIDEEPQIVTQQLASGLLQLLANELQKCVNPQYQLSLLIFFTVLIKKGCSYQNHCKLLQSIIFQLLRICVQIIGRNEQLTEPNLLSKSLILIRSIFENGFDSGNSQFTHYFSSIGGVKLVDALFVSCSQKQTQNRVNQIINDIYHYLQIC